MNKRPMIGLSRKDLVALIAKGDTLAIAEGAARNLSRERKGKSRVKAYDAPAPAAPAPAPAAPAPAEDMIARVVAEAVAAALAARGLSPAAPAPAAPAPAPAEDNTDDAAIWSQCLADANGSRWEAYDRMEGIIGKRKRSRIAAAAGVSVQSVSNALSKFRRGIAPDLSFAGK